MRLLASVVCAALLAVFLAGCQSNDVTAPDGQATSMKGYELYSWQNGAQWNFSLLEGTNREKTLAEIQSPDVVLKGVEALQPALENIAAGQYVTWWSPRWVEKALAFPPDDLVGQVERICKDQQLQLAIVK
jgi:hypothetical protein